MLNLNGKQVAIWGNLVVGNEDAVILKRCLDSCVKYLDKMLIGFNGNDPKIEELFATYPNVEWFKQKWEGDIVKARNEVFDRTPDDVLLFWIDSDDTLINAHTFLEFSQEVFSHEEVHGWACEWYYAHDKEGNRLAQLYRERVVWKGKYKWSPDRVHQVLEPQVEGICIVNEDIKILHLATLEKIQWAAIRNVNIIQKEYNEGVKNGNLRGKTIFDLARSLQGIDNYDKALKLYQDYIDFPGTPELEKAITLTNMGGILRTKCDFVKAKECGFKVISINPDIPDGYLDVGFALYGEGRIRESVAFLEMQFKFPPCKNFPIDPTRYTLWPMRILAHEYMELGRLKEAKACAEHVLSKVKDNTSMLDIVRICNTSLKELRVMDNIIEIKEAIEHDGGKVKLFVEGLPEFATRHPDIKKIKDMHYTEKM